MIKKLKIEIYGKPAQIFRYGSRQQIDKLEKRLWKIFDKKGNGITAFYYSKNDPNIFANFLAPSAMNWMTPCFTIYRERG